MGDKLILNFDESGNMGKKGRFFTIACVVVENEKPLSNVMKKAELKTKETFTKFKDKKEIKANEAYPIIKDYFIRKICSKKLNLRYIVADLKHIKQELLDDENLLYNFLLKILIMPLAKKKGLKELVINLDKRTIKVKSTNSFEDYIKTQIWAEWGLDLKVQVNYLDSQNSYSIQAADFVANAVQSKYEYSGSQHAHGYNLLKNKIIKFEHFPKDKFNK